MSVAQQIKAIEQLRGAALREKFREVVGNETRSNNRPYLIRQITKALENKADNKTAKKPPKPRERDPRLPEPGTVIEREHNGDKIRVKVLEDGFEYKDKTYRSLSAIAREATGTTWNGLLFFKLIPYARRDQAAE